MYNSVPFHQCTGNLQQPLLSILFPLLPATALSKCIPSLFPLPGPPLDLHPTHSCLVLARTQGLWQSKQSCCKDALMASALPVSSCHACAGEGGWPSGRVSSRSAAQSKAFTSTPVAHGNAAPLRAETFPWGNRIKESQNHRMVGVGWDLCGSSSQILLLKQGHLQ